MADQGALTPYGDRPKRERERERERESPKRGFLLLEIQAFGGRRKTQKTSGRQIFTENRRKPQIGVCHLRSVELSWALADVRINHKSLGSQSLGQ